MSRARLTTAAFLAWLASRVAPREMCPIFRAYCRMLDTFPGELERRRTYGVISAPWSIGPADEGKATLMLARGLESMAKAREGIDAIVKEPA